MIRDWHWRHGRVTLTWYNVVGDYELATGVVRSHIDPNRIPGPYDGVVTVIVANKQYERVAFHAKPLPTRAEFKALDKYLEETLGFTEIKYTRAK